MTVSDGVSPAVLGSAASFFDRMGLRVGRAIVSHRAGHVGEAGGRGGAVARQQTRIQVFIATPGGLEEERRAFREIVDSVNRHYANDLGFHFQDAGWEYVPATVRRPQGEINKEVRESDYVVVVLWDRWGSRTGDAQYTSGTEEEYFVARECLADESMPMLDVAVYFKDVPERQMADAGKELRKVLKFKEDLEASKELLYGRFATEGDFRETIRSQLHAWIRDWQRDAPKKNLRPVPETPVAPAGPVGMPLDVTPPADSASLASQAKALADRGRHTDAMQMFAQATTGAYDQHAYTEYVRFLRKSGRLGLARTMTDRYLRLAQEADDLVGEVEALGNLAILERQQGRNPTSLVYLDRALKANEELLASLGVAESPERTTALETRAFLFDNQFLTLRRLSGRINEAVEALEKSQQLSVSAGDLRGAGFSLRNLGGYLTRLGKLEEAEAALNDALAKFEKVEYASGQATALTSLGELYETRGEIDRAIEVLERSNAVTESHTPGRSVPNNALLARLLVKKGQASEGRVIAEESERVARELGTQESLATALQALGDVDRAEGDLELAQQEYLEALRLFSAVENPVGVAAAQVALARIAREENRSSDFTMHIERARAALDNVPHYALEAEISELTQA